MLIAKLAETLEESLGRGDETGVADNRLEDDGSDLALRTCKQKSIVQEIERREPLFLCA